MKACVLVVASLLLVLRCVCCPVFAAVLCCCASSLCLASGGTGVDGLRVVVGDLAHVTALEEDGDGLASQAAVDLETVGDDGRSDQLHLDRQQQQCQRV